jgi:hypothetical protein
VVRARLAIFASLALAFPVAIPAVAAPRPALKLLATQPLRIGGTGFRPRETIRLTVRTGDRVTRAATAADRAGDFAVTARKALVSHCTTLVIAAAGSDGTRAVLRRFPQCAVRGD